MLMRFDLKNRAQNQDVAEDPWPREYISIFKSFFMTSFRWQVLHSGYYAAYKQLSVGHCRLRGSQCHPVPIVRWQ